MKISVPIKITNNLYFKNINIKRNDKKLIQSENGFNFSSLSSNAIKNQCFNFSFNGAKLADSSLKPLKKDEFDEIFKCEKQRKMGLEVDERFSEEQLEKLAQLANQSNKFLLDRIVNEYDFDDSKEPYFLFSSDEIVRIMQSWNAENDLVLEKALFQKDEDKNCQRSQRFSVDEAILIAQMYLENQNVIDEMLFSMCSDDQEYLYDAKELIGLLKIFQKSEKKREKYIQVFNLLKGYSLPVEYINDFLPLSYSEIDEIINKIRKFNKKSGLQDELEIKFLQNDSGVEVSSSVTDLSCEDENVIIEKKATLFSDGSEARSTTEICDFYDTSMTWYQGKDRVIYTKYSDEEQEVIDYQIEFINNPQGEVQFVEYTKQSDELLGAYDITAYDLKNYPEDLDVFGLLKKGKLDETIEELGLEKGKKLSSVESSENETILTENFVRNGKTTTRRYVEKLDSQGQKVSTEYSYHIQDENGKELLSLDRGWYKDSDYSYRTKVNGKEYRAEFKENSLEFDIYDAEVLVNHFNVKDLFLEDDSEKDPYEFLNFLKQLPLDLVLQMFSKINGVSFEEDYKKGDCYIISKNSINLLNLSLDVLGHEMGHASDMKYYDVYSSVIDSYGGQDFPYFEKYPSGLTEISSDVEVLKAYNEEFSQFKKEYPECIQDFVEYFSPYPDGGEIGIEEFVAETYKLFYTYGNIDPSIRVRAEYIVRHFPMTVVKIAEVLKKIDGV